MDNTQSYLVYSPPKSTSHGHSVRGKNIRHLTQKVIDSFVLFFNAKIFNKLKVTLDYEKNELENAYRTIEKLNEFLGAPISETDKTGYGNVKMSTSWENEGKNILELLDFIDKINDERFLPFSKYWISGFYQCRENEGDNGDMMCTIDSGGLFIRFYLVMPYTIDDERTYDFLSEFQASLPFKLNSKYFRRLAPSKNGYTQWKLDEETQQRIDACLTKLTNKKNNL